MDLTREFEFLNNYPYQVKKKDPPATSGTFGPPPPLKSVKAVPISLKTARSFSDTSMSQTTIPLFC